MSRVSRLLLSLGSAVVLTGLSSAAPAAARMNPRADGASVRPGVATSEGAGAAQAKGRYKKEGGDCVWSAADSGPDQCTPVTAGRFKKSGTRCVWEASERGADQCTPARGRFKKEGDRCVWTADDSGPNQCNPRQPR
jgi:hypothetical protein